MLQKCLLDPVVEDDVQQRKSMENHAVTLMLFGCQNKPERYHGHLGMQVRSWDQRLQSTVPESLSQAQNIGKNPKHQKNKITEQKKREKK